VKTTIVKVPNKDVIKNLQNLNKILFDIRDFKFIKIETWFEFDKVIFQQLNPTLDDSYFYNHMPHFATSLLPPALKDALILADLAFPGRIKCKTGCTYWQRHRMNEISYFHGIYREALTNEKFKWPSVQTLPYVKVCQWVKKLGLFDQGIARSPIQRALASFTHLLSPSGSGAECLFWAMQGLEAFYCRGNGDLRRQLSEKSRLFLGKWDKMKNIVGSLYDFRSKFVHGSFNLERWNNDRMNNPEDKKDQDDLYKATMLAIRFLLGTLQKCAEQDITDVKFDYSMIIEK
jgi:hypothetical protein